MAINKEKKQEIESLIKNLALQSIPRKNFSLIFRYHDQENTNSDENKFVFIHEDLEPKIINEETLQNKAKLIAQIFKEKQNRDYIILCQPPFALEMIDRNIEVEPVLDDLPQIIGLRCRIRNGNDNDQILKVLKKDDACLLDNYNLNQSCLLALAPSLEQVLSAVLIVEKSSQAMIEAESIGGAKKLSYRVARNYRKAYLSKYSHLNKNITSLTESDYTRKIADEEMSLRRQLVEYGHKLIHENLVQGTWGNLSLRLDEQYMLVTPSGMAYERLNAYDMVRVNYHNMEAEATLKPSVEKGFHAAVYRKHNDINGMIHTHSFNSSVFAAANKPLPIILPEATLLLGHKTSFVPYFQPGTEKLAQAVAESISEDIWSTIMGSHGLACCGESLADAFNRTKLMEKSARYYLDAHKN